MARVFLSHASADAGPTGTVARWLAEDGHDVFLDQDPRVGIAPGEAWEDRLHERLRWADVVVSVVTAAYCRSAWCSAEVVVARTRGSKVVPVLFEADVVHPLLASLQRLDATVDPERARLGLIEELRRIDNIGGNLPDGVSPYPGLLPFGVERNRVFFGREADIRRLSAELRSQTDPPGTVHLLVGPSGCGKSSLLRAGLLPAMAKEPDTYALAPCTPGSKPVGAVVNELAVAAKALHLPGWLPDEVQGRIDAGGLTTMLHELLLAVPGPRRTRLLLGVDQFEEVLTRAGPADRARFVDIVAESAAGPLQIVATLRPEFLGPLLSSPECRGLATRLHTLDTLRPAALAAVIEKPAAFAGFEVDAGLVEEMVADTGTGDALPLLAFALQKLASGVTRGGRLSLEHYLHMGRVQGALGAQAEEALTDAVRKSGRSPEAVIKELLRLVVVDEQKRPTRWPVPRAELSETVATELAEFVDRRLLVSESDSGQPVIGVAHEALLTAWPPLAKAIDDRSTALRAKRRIEQAADEWDTAERGTEHLWDGTQLVGAVADVGARLTGHRATLSTDEVGLSRQAETFLQASMLRQRRKGRTTVAVLSVLLLLVSLGAGLAGWQWVVATGQQRLAVARQLLSQADLARSTDPRTALRLAVAAEKIHSSPEANANLLDTLARSRYSRTLETPDIVISTAYSPDGATLATGGIDGRVTVWDVADPTRPRQLGDPLPVGAGYVYDAAFSRDSRTLAAGGADKAIVLWDLTDPARPRQLGAPLPSHADVVHGIAFSPVDSTLASVDFAGRLVLDDITDPGRPTQLADVPTGHVGQVADVAFSPDGLLLATAGFDRTIRLWNVTDRSNPVPIGEPLVGQQSAVWAVAFAPRSPLLASVGAGGNVVVWDVATPGSPRQLGGVQAHTGSAYSVAFSPDGSQLATGGGDRTVGLWSMADPAAPTRVGDPLTGHGDEVYSVGFAPTSARTLVSGSADHTVVLWDLDGSGPAPLGPPLAGRSPVDAVAVSTAGLLACAGADGSIAVWDMSDPARPRPRGDPLPGSVEVRSLAFTRDGTTLAAGAVDGSLTLWDVAGTGPPRQLSRTAVAGGAAYSVAFAPDGGRIAVAGDDRTVSLWNVADPARPARIGPAATDHTGPVYSVAFSPDGTRLASGGAEGAVLLWDVAGPAAPQEIGPRWIKPALTSGGGAVYAVAFSPDGRRLAAGGAEGAVLIWDLSSGPRRVGPPLTSSFGRVFALAFSPDSTTMAAGFTNGSAAVWEVSDPSVPRQLGRALQSSVGSIRSLAFAPDAPWLAIGGAVGSTAIWDLSRLDDLRADPVHRACAVVGRGYDEREWSEHVPDLGFESTCPPKS